MARFLESLGRESLERLVHDWPVWARLKQRPPPRQWRTWLLLGGRGAGKTRTGAEWVRGVAMGDPHFPGSSGGRIALVGETYEAARDVMVEGESGLLAIHPSGSRPKWHMSRRELEWPNGVIAKVYSSADPEGLRGHQFGAAWCDELCKWRHGRETWDMLQFCLRLGQAPRQCVTTTPKPLKLLLQLLNEGSTVTVHSPTSENAANLAPGFLGHINSLYAGTSLGRQELEGEIVDQLDNALWQRTAIERNRFKGVPELNRIVIAVDPPASSGRSSAACGIVAAGLGTDGIAYVIADASLEQASPERWARQVAGLYHELEADLVLAEANQGGDMVRSVLHGVDPALPVRMAHARRGKWIRAEPVALLYECGRVKHAGTFPDLEDQMCAFGPSGMAAGISPDRVDALVWAITELMIAGQAAPRIRRT